MSRIADYFDRVIEEKSLSHAYMLELEDKETRMRLAREIAARVLCERGTGCGECASCRALEQNNHPDVITVTHEKPATLSVDEIRTQLVEDILIRPFRSEKKIYLVEDADRMNPQAQNAILKTLEEPPEYGLILLLTGNRNVFLPTILSRLIILGENGADGPAESPEGKNKLFEYLHRAESLTAADAAAITEDLKERGLSPESTLALLRLFFRDLALVKAGAKTPLHFPEEQRVLNSYAGLLEEPEVRACWLDLGEAENRIRFNTAPELVTELFFLRLRDRLRQGRMHIEE